MKKLSWLLILILPMTILSCETDTSKKINDINETHAPSITLPQISETNETIPTPTPFYFEFEVTFDGHQCSVLGPSETTIGSKLFVFTNNSGKRTTLYLCRLEAEKSWNDVLDYIGEPGSDVPEVVWCTKTVGTLKGLDERSYVWKFSFQEGEYSILCEQTEDPAGIWPGSKFNVRSIELADLAGSWSRTKSGRLLIFNADGSYGFASHFLHAENPNECYGQTEISGTTLAFIPDSDTPSGCAGDVIIYNIEFNEEDQLIFSVVEDECGIVNMMTNRPWNRNSP